MGAVAQKELQLPGAMEEARKLLSLTDDESNLVSGLDSAASHRVKQGQSFFVSFFLRGVEFDRVEPGLLVCSMKVPPRLTDSKGKLSPGAIAVLLDGLGFHTAYTCGIPPIATVNMSIQYLSGAKIDDELEITARVLSQEATYLNASISIKNKKTGELVANCLQLNSVKPRSKM